ncbi:hypothetical protein DS831_06080 [Bombilactobacillus bombi]|uniref:Baseplate J-like central domain-containing protein n=1 Tax=Bombilactobacillus bombi TaxID=1303590 RepID=A0A417ZEP4_9LACO|nr:baseplate J/gp47 family protein [Bombilactobacillus bombi]RHW49728.1 hypothetical protein DS831_06080 [Bombilactobacillus bombi]
MSPNELIKVYESRDYHYYLKSMLDKVPDNIDKREGSVIYDAVAPAAMNMALQSMSLANVIKETYIKTAEDVFLDYRAVERGTQRYPATAARVTAKFLDKHGKPINNVEVGDRFASLGDQPIFYKVISISSNFTGLLEAEELGTRPNAYLGQILPVTPNDSLYWAEVIEVSFPARDVETDEHLRQRLLSSDNWIAYGGNIADYLEMLSKISTVGAAQVYPVWAGGGTVKLVILDNDLMPASQQLLQEVKNTIDPPDAQGLGYGLAPIDHTVTVVAPQEVIVDVYIILQLENGEELSTLEPKIIYAIQDYFDLERKRWGKINQITGRGYSLTVYRSQILKEVMNVEGVVDADIPILNGINNDITMIENNNLSQLPILGKTTLIDRHQLAAGIKVENIKNRLVKVAGT